MGIKGDLDNTVYVLRVNTLPLYPPYFTDLDINLIGKDNTVIRSHIYLEGDKPIPINPYTVHVIYDIQIESVALTYKWYKPKYHYFITLEIKDVSGTLTVDNTVYDIRDIFNHEGLSKLIIYHYIGNSLDDRIQFDLDLNDNYNNRLYDFRLVHYSVLGEVH